MRIEAGSLVLRTWNEDDAQRLAAIADARDCLHLEMLILLTGENNVPARRLYESLGFNSIGNFGLLFESMARAND